MPLAAPMPVVTPLCADVAAFCASRSHKLEKNSVTGSHSHGCFLAGGAGAMEVLLRAPSEQARPRVPWRHIVGAVVAFLLLGACAVVRFPASPPQSCVP